MQSRLLPCLAVCLSAALAQTATLQTASAQTPIAYVYVSQPSNILGYSVASNGRLTPLPGSPYAGSVTHLSITRQFLFGPGSDNENIYSYAIGSNGALTPAAITNVQMNNPGGCAGTLGPTQIAGQFLYSLVDACDGWTTGAYKINSGGALGFVGNFDTQIPDSKTPVNPVRFLGNGQFGYITGCTNDISLATATTATYARDAVHGDLNFEGYSHNTPDPSDPAHYYCTFLLATDPTNHVALAVKPFDLENDDAFDPPYHLAAYTADSKGNLTTNSNAGNMPTSLVTNISTMSISPSGKVLAVGGNPGFQLFHFNGAAPITRMTSDLQQFSTFVQFAWDNHNHLYALSGDGLRVYTLTSSGIQEDPGSPYRFGGGSSLIVLSR
jgi:hypothetical protein